MPDGFALAAVGEGLRFRIDQMLRRYDATAVGTFSVVSRAPELLSATPPGQVTLSIYPYQLISNVSWSLHRLPAYSGTGMRREDEWLALDVHYLLCGYGPDPDVERALGIALLALHETRVLTPAILEAASEGEFPSGSQMPQALRDLAEQPTPVKVTPMATDLERLSQIWSMMNAGLRTGMCYEVGTLLMEQRERRGPAPPVAEARLGVSLLRRPSIARLRFAGASPAPFSDQPVASPGDRFEILGTGLRGDITEVRVGRRVVAVAPANVAQDLIAGTLPADLRPGVTTVQIVHRWPKPEGTIDPPASGNVAVERSNLLPIGIRPVLDDPAVTLANRTEEDGIVRFEATAHFDVPVGRRQRAELLLTGTTFDTDGNTRVDAFESVPPASDAPDDDVATKLFNIVGVAAGDYLVRLVLDGVESAMTSGAAGYDGPLLTVPA